MTSGVAHRLPWFVAAGGRLEVGRGTGPLPLCCIRRDSGREHLVPGPVIFTQELPMRHLALPAALLVGAALAVGCSDQVLTPPDSADFNRAPHGGQVPFATAFVAPADASQETHSVESAATGNTNFKLSPDGTALYYKLSVAGIENVTMSHIHLGARGVAGGVRVWLGDWRASPISVLEDETVAEGWITGADVVSAPADLTTDRARFDWLMEQMRAGNLYVNVHTTAYPPGEIRGQITPLGARRVR
jgi:hypothetical protein